MRAGPRFETPMGAKIGFTLWMLIWVPVILTEQGPQNFFWLCNIAQFLILYCLWSGNLLLLSSQAGTVVLVGIGWTLDVLLALALGGNSLTGFTDYMFSDELALSARLASLYHVAVPVFLLWLLTRTGYDRRGWRLQCAIGALAVIGGWLFTEAGRNINLVFDPFGTGAPPLPELAWVAVLLLAYPLLVYLPGHYLVAAILRACRRQS
jgi:hypothetical protein